MKEEIFGTVPATSWHGSLAEITGWRWGLGAGTEAPASLTAAPFSPSPLPAPFLHDPMPIALPRQLNPPTPGCLTGRRSASGSCAGRLFRGHDRAPCSFHARQARPDGQPPRLSTWRSATRFATG